MAFKMTPEQIQRDRLVSRYLRAREALDVAALAIKAPLPHNASTIEALKKAQSELAWYLTEVKER